MKKDFLVDYNNESVIKNWNQAHSNEILKTWSQEVPKHVNNFNQYSEDRNAVIYFALFVEYHINKILEILFPKFDSFLGISKTNISVKINILRAFLLFPSQIFDALHCIKEIRNEFAHEIEIVNLEDFKNLPPDRQKKTIEKLIKLTDTYQGDFEYEKINDTLRNRFKSLCMNSITALRLYQPLIQELREKINK